MSNIPLILNRAVKRLRTEGPIRTIDVAAYHLGELGYDWWYGTRTCGYVTLNELGLNQAALAMSCGTGARFISDLENGKETCQLGKSLQVLAALGLHLSISTPDGK